MLILSGPLSPASLPATSHDRPPCPCYCIRCRGSSPFATPCAPPSRSAHSFRLLGEIDVPGKWVLGSQRAGWRVCLKNNFARGGSVRNIDAIAALKRTPPHPLSLVRSLLFPALLSLLASERFRATLGFFGSLLLLGLLGGLLLPQLAPAFLLLSFALLLSLIELLLAFLPAFVCTRRLTS